MTKLARAERRSSARSAVVAAVTSVLAVAAFAPAELTVNVDAGTFGGDTARYNAAVTAMQNVVNRHNVYGDFGNYSVYVYYNSGIPTAQAGYADYGGSVGFGGTYPGERVAQHELNHYLGSGTFWNWANLFDQWGGWTGPRVSQLIQQFDGDGARIYRSGVHFYGYGLNYDTEVTNNSIYMRNVALMYAMRQDMGAGNPANPWSATNVTLTGSDAVGTSAFNWFGGGYSGNYAGWSDKYFAHAGAAYSTGAFDIRTPQGYAGWTFAGNGLTINSGGRLLYNGWGTDGRVTINNLVLAGGTLRHDQFAQDLFQLAGSVNVTTASTIEAANGNINILAPVTGAGGLTFTGGYTTTLSAINSYTGGTVVNAGTLALGNGGVSGAIRGTLTVNPGANVKLTAADALGTGGTSITQINLNGGTLDNTTAASNGYNASLSLTGGTLSASGGGAFHINAGAGKAITSLASATPSVISSDVVVRGANTVLPITVANGSAANDLIISGAIRNSTTEAGANGIIKNGTGTLRLSGANTYSGPTTVNGGTLVFASKPSNVGPITVADSATLGIAVHAASSPTLTSTSLSLAGTTSTLAFDFAGLQPTGPLAATGTFNATGTVNIAVQNAGTLPTGTYTLLGYSAYAGDADFLPSNIALNPRSTGTITNNGTNALLLNVVADRPVWTGRDSANWAGGLNGTLKNWKLQNGATATDYLEGDNVLFDDTATGSTAVTLAGNVAPAGMAFNSSSKSYTISSPGGYGISGSGGIIKTGTGTVTILTANSFSGGTTLNSGTLVAGHAAALGTGALTMNGATLASTTSSVLTGPLVVTGANVLGNAAQSGNLTFSGGLAGNGTLTNYVGSANNYNVFFNGDMSAFAGTLNYTSNSGAATGWWRFGSNNSTVNLANASLVLSKGNLTNLGGAASKNVGFTDGITGATMNVGALSGDGVFQASYNNSGPNTLVVGFLNTSTTFSGVIAGGNAGTLLNLTKVGSGTLTLTGANHYTGATTIYGGTVVANTNASLGGDVATLGINGGTLTSTATGVFVNTHGLAVGNAGATLNLLGSGTASPGQGARMVINQNNGLTGSGPLAINGVGTLASGSINARNDGTGVLVLNGSNNYAGVITLQNGAVLESAGGGALGSATVTLNNESEMSVTNGSTVGNALNVNSSNNAILSFTNSAGTHSGAVNLGANTLQVGLRNWYNYNGVQNGTISGVISGTGGLTVNSGTGTGGTLALSGYNTFSGNVSISNATVTAGSDIGNVYTNSNLGTLLPAAARSINVNTGSTLTFTGGNVLGTGGSTNDLNNVTVNITNGTFQTGLNGLGGGWWNKVGKLNLNNAVVRVGSGANNANFQGLALIGTVSVTGTAPSVLDNFAASDTATDGVHLGQNGAAGQSITFNVGDVTGNANADLTVSTRLLNTSANLAASGLTKTGGGTLSLTGANSYTGPTVIKAGVLKATAAAYNNLLNNTGGVDLQAGGQLLLDYSGGGSPIATVKSLLDAGYSGNFTTGKLRSTVRASGQTIGYGDNGTNAVTLRITLPGDADLDGDVDFNDFLTLQNSFGSSGTRFDQGNFNYDGRTDFNDFLLLQNNFGQSVALSAVLPQITETEFADVMAISHSDQVPEPTGLLTLALGAAALLRRKRL